jgi:Tfp pilus assembly protein FimV
MTVLIDDATRREASRQVSHQGTYRTIRQAPHPAPPVRGRGRPIDRHATVRAPQRVAASACVARPAARPVRFLVLLGLATAISVVLLGLLGAAGESAVSVPESTTVTQVRSGETLWDVARRAVPSADTAAVLDRIQQMNGLTSGAVQAGQPVRVPVAGS